MRFRTAIALLGTAAALAACGTSVNLPGESYEWPTPIQGAPFSVVGRTVDDTVSLHRSPEIASPTTADLHALKKPQARATGGFRNVDGSLWVELTAAGARGWAPLDSVSQLAAKTTATQDFSDIPNDPDLAELGRSVARQYASDNSTIAVVSLSDPKAKHRFVVVDVLGIDDDSLDGYRLAVTPGLGEAGYIVAKVTVQPLCSRAVVNGKCA